MEYNQPSLPNHMGQVNWPMMTAPVQGQTKLPLSAPAFESTLKTSNPVFRPLIKNFGDMDAKLDDYIASNNVENTIADHLSLTDHDRQNLIQRLFNAFYDDSNTIEPQDSQHHRYIYAQNHFTEGVVHMMLWKLLQNIEDAQEGMCNLPPWYTTGGPVYKQYPTFAARFKDIETALQRKQTNLTLNAQKNAVQTIGIQVCRDRGVTRNEDGDLQDKDGNKVAGKRFVPTALARTKNAGIKKRRKSERAKVTSRLMPPDYTQPLESQEHEHFDWDAYLAQDPNDAVNAAPDLSQQVNIGAQGSEFLTTPAQQTLQNLEEPQYGQSQPMFMGPELFTQQPPMAQQYSDQGYAQPSYLQQLCAPAAPLNTATVAPQSLVIETEGTSFDPREPEEQAPN
ncbi:hypothetical protein GGS21DRAFT_547592 [Xylaria nigripes]|nr:hypothetical protein GGS21DRAFT_547592 [Xylaria nigripes]